MSDTAPPVAPAIVATDDPLPELLLVEVPTNFKIYKWCNITPFHIFKVIEFTINLHKYNS